jgi:phage terminase small subunit
MIYLKNEKIGKVDEPEFMSLEQTALFYKYFNLLKERDLIEAGDQFLLAALAKYQLEFEQIEGMLGDDLTYKDKNGVQRVSPLVRHQKNCLEKILDLSKRFGLTPADRKALGQVTGPKYEVNLD